MKRFFFALIIVFAFSLIIMSGYSDYTALAAEYDYSDSLFEISSDEDFYDFYTFATSGNYKNFAGKTVRLNADIDASRIAAGNNLYVFSAFNGTFDGGGHSISGLSGLRLVDTVGSQGVIKNLYLKNISVRGAAVAGTNRGTISGVTVSGSITASSVTAGSFVNNNVGTIQACANLATYSSSQCNASFSGFAGTNTGTITGCFFGGKFVFDYSRDYGHTAAGVALNNGGTVVSTVVATTYSFTGAGHETTEQFLFALAKNNSASDGSVSDCAFIIDDDLPDDITVSGSEGTLSNTNGIISKDNKKYFRTEEGDLTETTEAYCDLSEGVGCLLSGEGSESSPYILDDYADLEKLKFTSAVGAFSYALSSDISLADEDIIGTVAGFDSCGGTIYGKGYALIDCGNATVFSTSYNLNGKNVGFIDCVGTSLSGGTADGYVDFPVFAATENKSVTASSLVGSGTPTDPYVVTDKESLKALDGIEGYAILSKDIVINSKEDSGYSLGIAELKVALCGNGHSIIGLTDESLAKVISGEVKHLSLRSVGDAPLCQSNLGTIAETTVRNNTGKNAFADNNGGAIESVFSYGSFESGVVGTNTESGTITGAEVYAEVRYAFAKNNNGQISLSENFGSAPSGYSLKVFDIDGIGTIKNSISYVEASDGDTTASCYCFDLSADKGYYGSDGARTDVTVFDYSALCAAGFDFESVFGYAVGEDEPSLRERFVQYKTTISVITGGSSLYSTSYSPEISYEQSEINEAVTNINGNVFENTQYSWEFNGEALSGDIKNAGEYKMTAVFSGNDYYLPATEVLVFTINKATSAVSPEFDAGALDTITEEYDGEAVVLPQIIPNNNSVLTDSMGFTASYSLRKDGTTVLAAKNAGSYEYVITFSSPNYYELQTVVELVINKKQLSIAVGDASCSYLSGFAPSAVAITVTDGLVEADEGKTIAALTPDYAEFFVCGYSVGDPAGEYDIDFVGSADNYIYTVTKGTLTVSKISVPLDGVSFYGATAKSSGTHSVVYDGNTVVLSATYPDGMSVEFGNNSNKNVGDYVVTATFSIDGDNNYIPVTLNCDLTITKAEIVIALPDGSSVYGSTLPEAYSLSDMSVKGIVGGESAETLFPSGLTAKLYDSENNEVSGIADAGIYAIKLTSLPELANYSVVVEEGEYVVEKASLALLKNNVSGVSTEFLNGSKIYDGEIAVRRIDFFTEEQVVASYEYLLDGEPATEIRDAGEYTVTATVVPIGELADNYVVTAYTCKYVIEKKSYSVAFLQPSYTFSYDGSNKAVKSNFEFTGLPEDAVTEFSCDGPDGTAIRADEYIVRIDFAGSKNENGCFATAKLTINPRPVRVTIKNEYDYDRSGAPTEVEIIAIEGAVGEELAKEDIQVGYRNASGVVIPSIIAAGSYYVDIAVKNSDYTVEQSSYNITVNKAVVPFEMGELGYVYGTVGTIVKDEFTYEITDSSVTIKNYNAEGYLLDITIRIDKNVGSKTVTADQVQATTNYDFVPTGTNKIVITPKELPLIWTVDGTEQSGLNYSAVYLGKSQKSRFGHNVAKLAFDESPSDLDFRYEISGASDDIYNVGNYTIKAVLYDNPNYTLADYVFSVEVTKALMTISVEDIEVYQWENYSLSYTCFGRVGEDADKSVATLKGADIRAVTDYNENLPAGSVCSITVRARFDNYETEVVREGTITVKPNPYPDYLSYPYWHDVSYVFTGEAIRVELIGNIPDEVTVVYSNNVHTDAGTYTVGVTITYPSGRQKAGTCLMTVTSAVPTVKAEDAKALFRENYVLSEGDIKGNASHNGFSVPGEFVPDEGQYMQEGVGVYGYTFVPTDEKNYERVKGSVNIESVKITLLDFTFDKPDDISLYGDGKLEIYDDIKMYLNPVLDGLKLYRNGSEVSYVEFNKTEEVVVKVTSDGLTAFEYVFSVSRAEEQEPIVISEESFEVSGLRFVGKKIEVNKNGGRAVLSASFKTEYAVYVDGLYVEELVLNGDEQEIVLTVKHRRTNKTVFSGIYTIEIAEEISQEKGNDYALYLIIGGSIAGVAAVIALALFIWRKKHG